LRGVTDAIERSAHFLFLPCDCGVKIKLPPKFARAEVTCPRCARRHAVPRTVPQAQPVGGAMVDAPSPQSLQYRRTASSGWESFRCGHCEATVQLSPSFHGSRIQCPKCQSRIDIV
jgi:heat shock protein HtpX